MQKRHNLSGIYIFDQFFEEDRRYPTCIEDCQKETRDTWLKSLEPEALLRCCQHLCDTLHGVAEQFNLYAGSSEENTVD